MDVCFCLPARGHTMSRRGSDRSHCIRKTALRPSDRSTSAEPAIIEKLHEDYMKPGVLSLAAGVSYMKPPRDCLSWALEAVLQSDSADPHRYGDVVGDQNLLEVIRRKLETVNKLTGQEIMVTAGANQAFINVLLSITDVGDEVILTKPYYFSHLVALQLCGVVPVMANSDPELKPDPIEIKASITPKTKALVLVNPGNPSGSVAERELVEELETLCHDAGIWLISDEAYEHFLYNSVAHYSPSLYPNQVINIFTMSKSYALAGWRVGYISYPKILSDSMLKINDTVPTHACRTSQSIATKALEDYGDFPAVHAKELERNRDEIWRVVEKYATVKTTGAFYFFIKAPGGYDDLDATRILAEKYNVLVVPGVAFGMPGYLRISYAGLRYEVMKTAAACLEEGLLYLSRIPPEREGAKERWD